MSSRSTSADRARARPLAVPSWALLAFALGLGGCNALVAQNPSSALQPVNAVYRVDEPRMMLEGYDLVAYFTEGKAVPGRQQWRFEYEDVAYHFAGEASLAAFKQDPRRFQPAYHGYDATRIAYAIPEPADPHHWRLIDGRLFFFADAASLAAFELDTAGNIALADRYWKSEVGGHNSGWQRTRRLVDRVPHYKSRDELAREVAAAKSKAG